MIRSLFAALVASALFLVGPQAQAHTPPAAVKPQVVVPTKPVREVFAKRKVIVVKPGTVVVGTHRHHGHGHAAQAFRWNKWHHGRHIPVVRFGWPVPQWHAGFGWYVFPQTALAQGHCFTFRFSVAHGRFAWFAVPIPAWYVPAQTPPVIVVPPTGY